MTRASAWHRFKTMPAFEFALNLPDVSFIATSTLYQRSAHGASGIGSGHSVQRTAIQSSHREDT
eukprot:969747-Rhodomonas_salina.1